MLGTRLPELLSFYVTSMSKGSGSGREPDCEDCHVSTSHKVTSTCSSGKVSIISTCSSGKASTRQYFKKSLRHFNVGQVFGASISLVIWGIHLAGNQIMKVAMFLHHTRSSLLVVQEKLKTFNVGQAFGASISLFGKSL